MKNTPVSSTDPLPARKRAPLPATPLKARLSALKRSSVPNPFSGKTLLIFSSGYPLKEFIFKRMRELGCYLILANDSKNWAEKYVDELHVVNRLSYSECLKFVKELNKRRRIDGIITFWNDDVLLCAKLAAELELVGLPYEQARICKNKFLFRDFCAAHGIPTPKYKYANTPSDVAEIKKTFHFPVVVKPVWGDSSKFVVKVETPSELDEILEYVRSNHTSEKNEFDATISVGEEKQIFIEEYIDGEEVDVNGIIQNGRLKVSSIADNDKTEEPFFIETGFSMPSNLPDTEQKALIEQIDRIFEILNIPDACFQYEAKSTPTGPVPIEINLRMGGDEAFFFTKNVWGIDIIEDYVKLVLGIRIETSVPDQPYTYCAGEDFLCEHSGVLVELDIDQKLSKRDYLDQFIFIKKVGDPVFVPPEGFEYLGWISVKGDNMVEAQTNLEEAMNMVKFRVARFHPTSSIGKTTRASSLSLASVERERILKSIQVEKVKKIKQQQIGDLRVGLLTHSRVYAPTNILEEKRLQALNYVQGVLQKLHAPSQIITVDAVERTIRQLNDSGVDIILNLFKELENNPVLEASTAGILDFFQVPYVGASAKCLSLCNDKILVKKLLTYHDIPTPKFDYAFSPEDKIDFELEFPLIVKPTDTDNSLGIANESVVTNRTEMKARVQYITEVLKRPALIEEFIEGYEVEACVIGNDDDLKVLPLTKISFDKLPKNFWHILSYEAKLNLLPEIYSKIKIERPAKFEKKLEQLISELAIDTYNILGCHDYGLVEIRVSQSGNPYVIELTPNPSLDEAGTFIQSAKLSGMSDGQIVTMILNTAISRYQNKPSVLSLS